MAFASMSPCLIVGLADSMVTPSGPSANLSVTSPSKFLPRTIPIATSFISPWWRVVDIRDTLSLNVFSALKAAPAHACFSVGAGGNNVPKAAERDRPGPSMKQTHFCEY